MNTISCQEAADFPEKQQDDDNDDKITKPSPHPTTSSSSWLGLKDPRIVRVSRAFGGKDRHSKVRTVRGLRDRRVRLSVPTAIQLYDLQDRLGLNQPSKVVDWLLNAAKNDVDELPPLQMPPLTTNYKEIKTREVADDPARTGFWGPESSQSSKYFSFKPMSNTSDYNYMSSFSQWEPNSSNLPMSLMPASTLSLSSGPHDQPSYNFPAGSSTSSQLNQFQMLMMSSGGSSSQNLLPSSHLYSIGQSMRPFHFSVSAPQPLENSQNNSEGDQEQEQFQER